MQDAAFHRALDELLEDQSGDESAPRRRSAARKQPVKRRRDAPAETPAAKGTRADRLVRDLGAHPQIRAARTVADQALWILRIARDEHDLDGLSAPDLARVLKEKFRISATPQGVRQGLDRVAGDYVTRDTGGSSVVYKIMARGEDHLDSAATEDGEQPNKARAGGGKTKRRRSTGKRNSKQTKGNGNGPPETGRPGGRRSGRSRSGRPSAAASLSQLTNDGFFGEARTIGEVRAHLEQKGYRYKPSELSPGLLRLVRDGTLARNKNDAGHYDYQQK